MAFKTENYDHEILETRIKDRHIVARIQVHKVVTRRGTFFDRTLEDSKSIRYAIAELKHVGKSFAFKWMDTGHFLPVNVQDLLAIKYEIMKSGVNVRELFCD